MITLALQALVDKSEVRQQPQRGLVARVDIGADAMQLEPRKPVLDQRPHGPASSSIATNVSAIDAAALQSLIRAAVALNPPKRRLTASCMVVAVVAAGLA